MSGLLSNAVSGLRSVQRALDTTGHNIANANTPGYSRQSAVISAREPSFEGSGYLGNGSMVETVRRNFDGYVEGQLRDAISENGQLQYMDKFTGQVNELVGDLDTGLGQQIQSFYNAAEDVANNPTDVTARQAYLGAMDNVASRLNTLDRQLESMEMQLGSEVKAIGDKINAHASEIADLNREITEAQFRTPNQKPNDLLDRRDRLIRELAEEVDLRVQESPDGSVNLSLGSGQPLVLNATASDVDVKRSPAGISVEVGGTDITSLVKGGRLGGIIEAQDGVVTPLRNELGRVAAVFTETVNSVQAQGSDLNGAAGGDLLATLEGTGGSTRNALVPASNEGTGSATFELDDVEALTGETYVARWNGTDSTWDIYGSDSPNTRLEQVGPTGTSTAVPGVEITFDGAAQGGDRLVIRPTEGLASQVATTTSDGALVAAADAGSAAGARDNENMRRLIDEAKAQDIGGIVNAAVGKVGTTASQVRLRAEAAEMTMTGLENRRESVSGVNLDEEAANLLQFQQAYQALARTISVQDRVFQSLLGAMG
ncbi:MAG: flagellar hook-associated protein FlgK [Halothiobacillaceae bacterium]